MTQSTQKKLIRMILITGLALSGAGHANTNLPQTSSPDGMDQQSTQLQASDQELKSQAQSKLNNYSDKLTITVNNGIIQLAGTLDSDTDYENAIVMAESIKGVRDVNADNLNVKGSNAPLNDAYITAKVKGALIRTDLFDTDIPSWTISVETKNGKVYLSGKAPSEEKKQKILDVVNSIKGVHSVDAQIEIASGQTDGQSTKSDDNGKIQNNNTNQKQSNNQSY